VAGHETEQIIEKLLARRQAVLGREVIDDGFEDIRRV